MDTSNTPSPHSASRQPGSGTVLLALAAILAAYLFLATQSTLWDADEPRFAQATVEMMASGNYLYPTLNGQLRPDKPILIYWLMSLPARLFGPTELAMRLFSCLGAVGACGMTYLMGRWMFDSRTGLWAMLIMGSTLMLSIMGTLATADGVLLFFTSSAMACFVHGWWRGWNWRHGLLMGLALGGAMLTKGPPGLLPVLGMAGATWWLRRDTAMAPGRRAWWVILTAIVLGSLIFLAWAIPANLATDGRFAQQGLGHHVLDRMVSPHEGHGKNYLLSLPTYLAAMFWGFFPWTLLLPGALAALACRSIGDLRVRTLLWAWIIPIFVLLTLVVTKLPHYILPIWPALALATAATLQTAMNRQLGTWTSQPRRWWRGGIWFFTPMSVGLGAGLIVAGWTLSIPELRWPATILGVLALVWTGCMVLMQLREQPIAPLLLVGYAFLYLLLWGQVVHRIDPALKPSPVVARIIHQHTAASVPVALREYDQGSLTFYVGRGVLRILPYDVDVVNWALEPGPGALVIPQERWEAIQRDHPDLGCTQLGQASGINHNKRGQPVTLLVIGKNL